MAAGAIQVNDNRTISYLFYDSGKQLIVKISHTFKNE